MSDWSRELGNQADTITYKDDGTRVAIWKPRRVSLVGFAGFCALLLILGAVLSGIGVVYQSDTQNTYYTKIITSLGGVYNVTQIDLQIAVYSLNSTSGGFIFIPYDSGLEYSTLDNPYNVHFIDFESFATTGTVTITAGS